MRRAATDKDESRDAYRVSDVLEMCGIAPLSLPARQSVCSSALLSRAQQLFVRECGVTWADRSFDARAVPSAPLAQLAVPLSSPPLQYAAPRRHRCAPSAAQRSSGQKVRLPGRNGDGARRYGYGD